MTTQGNSQKLISGKFHHPLSGLSHFLAAILAIGGMFLLLQRTAPLFAWTEIICFSIFSGAMIAMFTCSTLYHWLPHSAKSLRLWRTIDHIMIFVFIAATYTPICVLSLRGCWGWSILVVIWTLALAGLFMKIWWLQAPRILYTSVYVIMGWIIIVAIWPLSQVMSRWGIYWMLLGGGFYSTGALIYALKKPDPWPAYFGFHEIFHIFIMLGSLAHFWMIYRYVGV